MEYLRPFALFISSSRPIYTLPVQQDTSTIKHLFMCSMYREHMLIDTNTHEG